MFDLCYCNPKITISNKTGILIFDWMQCLTSTAVLLYLFGFGFIRDSLSITAKGDWLMASIQANDLRKGNIIIYNKDPYRILEFEHRTPGNLRAFVQVKMRNMRNGSSTATRFSSTEQLEKAQLEQHEMQYLYSDGELHHFMNNETYEQVALNEEILGDSVNYLIPNLQIEVEFLDGNPISVELPPVLEF